jgi:hypothetical protein
LKKIWLVGIALALGACSQSDTDKVRSELKTSGEQLKKEVKSDAEVAKRDAIKAGHEAKSEAQKVKRDLDGKN